MDRYFFIGATLGLTVLGQIVLKSRAISHTDQGAVGTIDYLVAMYSDFRVLSVFVCAVAASVCWSLAVQRTPLTIAYPFMALTFAIVPLASVVLLRESVSLLQVCGVGLIVIGVAISATTH